MKRKSSVLLGLLCSALCLLSARPAVAQNAKPPTQLTYQGFLTDGNGVPFGNTAPVNKTVIFRIYDALTGGTIKWSSQQVVTVDKGYFSALLGQGSAVGSEPFNADLTGVFTGSSTVSDRYLELNADGTTIAPRLRFLAAPYALLAKSATELLDPVTGSNVVAIAGGNLTSGGTVTAAAFSGSGANLTNLNGANLTATSVADSKLATITTAGKVANSATTATPANAPGTIVGRDGSGNFSAGTITATFSGNGAGLTSLNASQISSGTLDNARTTATSANTANAIVARDGSGNITAGQVVASSFKITGTTTLVPYSLSRFSAKTVGTPIAGVSQTTTSGTAGRQDNVPSDWYRAAQTSKNTTFYYCEVTVPSGEKWELAYNVTVDWETDDSAAVVWTLNDALTDDSSSTLTGRPQGIASFGQTFLLDGGSTYQLRMKGTITGGSGSDSISFPGGGSCHCVVKKYKSN